MTVCLCSYRVQGRAPRAVAFWKASNGNRAVLCQSCLDHWFDNADDDPSLEPVSWGWL